MDYIWCWFQTLTLCRPPGHYTIGPITHQEIKAWAWLYRVRPRPSEIKVLRDLDDAFLLYHSSKNSKEQVVDHSTPMTPGLFDNLFR